MTAAWEPLTEADLPAVCALAGRIHPALPERAEVFAEKFRLFPAGCLKLASSGRTEGYALAHPWSLGSAPALDSLLGALPAGADCLYIHDVALLPGARGRGAARHCCAALEAQARSLGLPALALVSVYGTAPLWSRLGFSPAAGPALDSYGPGAVYMKKELT